eukprot:TRINITY_DN3374_c0_g1_i1.p1 TRINITY_DN3374_c0_g1~~TRINITY_DN3374_c0_g1_i1.p1  ORF type:complete len:483 (-),score=86.44 TRINITY_DN3374_c0_g1_i1:36-1484(-)
MNEMVLFYLLIVGLLCHCCLAEWVPCPVYSDGRDNPFNVSAMCTTDIFPLDHTKSSGSIPIFTKKIFNTGYPSQTDIYMLMGGPGFSGSFLEDYAVLYLNDFKSVVYIPDHRGTGRSNPLSCDFSNCVADIKKRYGDQLNYYTTTQAAYDVIRLIETFSSGKDVTLYGWSYGSYLANRVLQINSNIASRVILEGTCTPDTCKFDHFDKNTNIAGMNGLNLCPQYSQSCKKYLRSYPNEMAGLIFQLLDSRRLPCYQKLEDNIDSEKLRSTLGGLIGKEGGIVGIGPILKRLYYCSDSDAEQLRYLLSKYATEDVPYSYVLGNNIIMGEMLTLNPTPPNPTQFLENQKDLFFSMGQTLFLAYTISSDWPVYPSSPLYNQYAHTNTPILLLSGELDPQVSHSFSIEASQRYKSSTLISVPFSPHHPTMNTDGCAMHIMKQFILTNTTNDISCLQKIPPPDYEGTTQSSQQLSQDLFGTPNLWNN